MGSDLAPSNAVSKGWDGTSYYAADGYTTAGWTITDGKVAQVTAATPAVTVTGIKSTDGIKVENGKVTIDATNLADGAEKVELTGDGYTLEISDVQIGAPEATVTTSWSDIVDNKATYTQTATTGEYWTKSEDGKSYVRTAEAAVSTDLFTIEGITSTSNINVASDTITLSAEVLPTDGSAVSVEGDYKLALGDNVTAAVETKKATLDNGLYTTAGVTTAGYKVVDNKISYFDKDVTEIKFNGLADTAVAASFTIDGDTIKIGKKAIPTDGTEVSVEGDYTLALVDGLPIAVETKKASLSEDKTTYTTAGVTVAGYKVADNKISYLSKDVTTIKFTGLSDKAKASQITIDDDNVITLAKKALGTNGAKISVTTKGYTLALDGLTEVINANKGAAEKASYYFATAGGAPEGYVATTGSDGKSYFVESDAKFAKAYAEYGINIKVIEGDATSYVTEAPEDYFNVTDKANGNYYTDKLTTNAALTNASISGDDLVIAAGKQKLTVAGAANDTVDVTANGVDYTASAGVLTNTQDKAVTITSAYDASEEFKASKNIKTISATSKVKDALTIDGSKTSGVEISGGKGADTLTGGKGADTLSGGNGNDSLKGGKGADTLDGGKGDDILTGGKGNDLFVYSAGNDTITDYTAGKDKISLDSAYTGFTFDNDDVILSFDAGSLTIKDAKGKKIYFADGTSQIFKNDPVVNGDTAILPETYDKDSYDVSENDVKNANAATTTTNISLIGDEEDNSLIGGAGDNLLTGNAGNDTLVGNAGNDTLNGGEGDDLLNGGEGSDTFVYSGGKDTIDNFNVAEDLIENTSGFTVAKELTVDDGYTLTFDDDNTLTISTLTGGETFDIKTGNQTHTYSKEYVTDNDASVTLYAGAASYKAADNIVSIDGSAAQAIEITGNANDNAITLGAEGGKVDGGKGKDTVIAGAGSDTIVISEGGDVIRNFDADNDKLSLGKFSASKITEAKYRAAATTFTVGSTTVQIDTLAKDAKVSFEEGGAMTSSGVISSQGKYSLFSTASGTYTGDDTIKVIDASAATKRVTLEAGTSGGTLTGGSGKDTFIYNGGKVVINNFEADEAINTGEYTILRDVNVSSSNVTLTVSNGEEEGTIELAGAKDKNIKLNNKDALFSVSGRIYNDTKNPTAVTLTSSSGSYNATTDPLGSAIETIDASASSRTIEITGNKRNNVIIGSDGGSTLDGKSGNTNTLKGGAGADTFIHNGGNNNVTEIKDYNLADGDRVSISAIASKRNIASTVANTKLSQGLIDGTLTVELADGSVMRINSTQFSSENSPTKQAAVNVVFSGQTNEITFGNDAIYSADSVTLMSAFNNKFDATTKFADTTSVAINASHVESKGSTLKLIGTDGADTILSGGGEKGSTTLQGGKGNDSLKGVEGIKDTFVYEAGDGNDVIVDFTSGEDTLQLKTKRSLESVSTIRGGLEFNMTDGGKVKIDGFSDKVFIKSDNKLYWFDDADGDGTSEWVTAKDSTTKAALKSIMKSGDYAVLDLEYANWSTTMSEAVTFGDRKGVYTSPKTASYFDRYKK